MLVRLQENYKDIYTVSDLERARAVIKMMREDESVVAEYAEMAVSEALNGRLDSLRRVLKATAHTAKNCRVWDAYELGSEDMDVWVNAIAETVFGFIRIGAYLSDIWQKGATPFSQHMYIKYYTEEK